MACSKALFSFPRWLWRWMALTQKDGWAQADSPFSSRPQPSWEARRPLTACLALKPTTIWSDVLKRYWFHPLFKSWNRINTKKYRSRHLLLKSYLVNYRGALTEPPFTGKAYWGSLFALYCWEKTNPILWERLLCFFFYHLFQHISYFDPKVPLFVELLFLFWS